MAKKKAQDAKQISNRRARHDYDLGDGLVVGIALSGAETKSLRRGHGHLKGSYVTVKDNELWLVNATITGDSAVRVPEEDKTRNRKLLAKQREIAALMAAKQQGQTIVPLELLTRGRYIKLRIASGRGRKKYDKRETIKRRDQDRSNNQELKQHR
ncbi:MAG: SsrA-binding protein SmpB [Patescibacteria group bacterium]